MLEQSKCTARHSPRRLRRSTLSLGLRLSAGLAVAVAFFPAWLASQAPPQVPLTNPPPRPTTVLLPAANRPPDANDQMEMRQQQVKRANFEAANTERKRQLDADSALLLKLAAELKAEIDKTSQDTLSLSVVRKAEEIQRLAHNVQVKMKLTVGAD